MQLNLKTTILLSSALAGLLNLGDFVVGLAQHQDAFFTGWVYADSSSTPQPQSTPAKLLALPPIAATTPVTAASNIQPSADSAMVAAALTRAGLKPEFAPIYLKVQHQTGTPWQLLAAVHRIETGQSGNTSRSSSAGAIGPMQFMPATFAKYGADGDGNGSRDITDVDDAVLSAGKYLAANGAAKGNYQNALYAYNHSWSYVATVRNIASKLGL
jgi:soluble lytic murein transglycosylase-like protein